jgi:hypothetical protein
VIADLPRADARVADSERREQSGEPRELICFVVSSFSEVGD